MKISNTYQKFANRLRNQRVLEHPEEFLGPNWKDVLNFWIFLDTLTKESLEIIEERYYDDRCASYRAAYNAAIEATNRAAVNSVCFATISCYATSATYEIIGSHILKSQGKSLVLFPLFLNI